MELQFAFPEHENASQDQLRDFGLVAFGVSEGQSRAPRAAKDLPLVNPKFHPQPLNVRDQMPENTSQ